MSAASAGLGGGASAGGGASSSWNGVALCGAASSNDGGGASSGTGASLTASSAGGASCRSVMLGRRPLARLLVEERGSVRRVLAGRGQEFGRRLGEGVDLVGPLRRAERLVLEFLQLSLVGAMGALQFEVLADCVVKDAHQAFPRRVPKTRRYSLWVPSAGQDFPAMRPSRPRCRARQRKNPSDREPCPKGQWAAAPGRRSLGGCPARRSQPKPWSSCCPRTRRCSRRSGTTARPTRSPSGSTGSRIASCSTWTSTASGCGTSKPTRPPRSRSSTRRTGCAS